MSIDNNIGGFVDTGIAFYNAITGQANADRNFRAQERAFNYNKELNERLMRREDTAMQRARADFDAAGLHPSLLAGGQGATSSAPSPAPSSTYVPHEPVRGSALAIESAKLALERQRSEISNIDASTKKMSAETGLSAFDLVMRERYDDMSRQIALNNSYQTWRKILADINNVDQKTSESKSQESLNEARKNFIIDKEGPLAISQSNLNSAREDAILNLTPKQSEYLSKQLEALTYEVNYMKEHQAKVPIEDILSRKLDQITDALEIDAPAREALLQILLRIAGVR